MKRVLAAALAAALALTVAGCKPETGPVAGSSRGPSRAPRAQPGYPSSMAALGDSITAGVGSCLALLACTQYSWATGDRAAVNSHYRRILAANPAIAGKAYNFADGGAVVADLPDQARLAVGAKVSYVAVLVGANDACRRTIGGMTPVTQFRASLDQSLRVLKSGLPAARVLLVSIPDVYRVWQVGHADAAARLVWGLGACQSLLAAPKSTASADVARRAQFAARINAYNQQIAAACRAYGPRCRYDGGAAHRYAFSLADLSSLDYFHPNAAGQNELATLTYPGRFTW